MQAPPIDLPGVTTAGFAALQRGDPTAARAFFDQAIAAGAADAAVWFGLSRVHRSLGAADEESAALDQALGLDARHVPALVAKGDWFAKARDRRATTAYYSAAIKIAAAQPSLSPEWRAEIRRIEAASEHLAREYEEHLVAALTARGLGSPGSERFAHAIDLLLGKRQIYPQQPKYFYFPELPQIQFFDRRDFPWAGALEGETAAIAAELRSVLETGGGTVPYIRRESNRPAFDPRGLLDNPNWSAFFLIKDGAIVPENAARCPRTLAALQQVPLCRMQGRTPSALFSILQPGMRIPPHHGFLNTRLICHLPLIVPPDCGLRVGNETRAWRSGELLCFDDSIEHEAWNGSRELRVVLIFDVWRPELTAQERELVAAMLGAIDVIDGPGRWTE